MEAIEPIAFELEGSGLDPTDFKSRMGSPTGGWDDTHDYILHQSLEKQFDEISRHTLMENFHDMVMDETEVVDGYLPSLRDSIISTFMPPMRRSTVVYHMSDVIAVPVPHHQGHVHFISSNKNKVRSVRDDILDELEQSPNTFGALGVDGVVTYSGSEFTLHCLRETGDVKGLEQGEMGEFEEQIYDQVEPISEAFTHNVKVSFEYPQEPEYDIVFSLAPGNTITIEVEDHSGTDSQPEQSDLIDDPAAESDYINAGQAFSVCKGESSEILGQFKPKAELTNVDIIEQDQCSERISQYIEEEMAPQALNLSSGPVFSKR